MGVVVAVAVDSVVVVVVIDVVEVVVVEYCVEVVDSVVVEGTAVVDDWLIGLELVFEVPPPRQPAARTPPIRRRRSARATFLPTCITWSE